MVRVRIRVSVRVRVSTFRILPIANDRRDVPSSLVATSRLYRHVLD